MISVPNRPFSTDIITGLMLPDGIFVATLGKQLINAHFTNSGASTVADSSIYLESVSHPGIVVTPNTRHVSNLASGASRVLSWEADLSGASAGVHYFSFIVETASGINLRRHGGTIPGSGGSNKPDMLQRSAPTETGQKRGGAVLEPVRYAFRGTRPGIRVLPTILSAPQP